MTTELGAKIKNIRDLANSLGVYTVDGGVNFDAQSSFVATVKFDQAIELLKQFKPKIVYIYENIFDLEGEIPIEVLSVEDDDSFKPFRNELNGIKKTYGKFIGQTSTMMLSFLIDGILHFVVEQDEWADEFEAQLADLADRHEGQKVEISNAEADKDSDEIKEKAEILSQHPAYGAGKSSFEKRLFFAENLFPDTDDYALQRITTHADNILWLKSTGFEKL